MNLKSKFAALIFAATLMATGIISCSKDGESNTVTPKAVKKGLQLANDTKFGKVLTDVAGKTLYFFAKDVTGVSACNTGCLDNWPIYYSVDATTDLNVDRAQIGEITRADGKKQTTYKGWPLYYFASDMAAGEINGDGIGKIWYVAKPDYLLMVANAQLIGSDIKKYKSDYTEGEEATTYFTDDKGRTLYTFINDKAGKNNFTDATFSNDGVWPIFQKLEGALPSIVDKSLITTISIHTKKQLAYKGWPLYYFGQDAKRGENKGVSFPRVGVWSIVNTSTAIAPAL